jgi:TrmH family RNA methyltransferase
VLAADLSQGPELAALAALDWPELLALSPTGADLLAADLPARAGFVLGLEGPGLGQAWPAERRRSIPMTPGVESLNAAAALAVALGIWKARAAPPS